MDPSFYFLSPVRGLAVEESERKALGVRHPARVNIHYKEHHSSIKAEHLSPFNRL